MKRLVLAVACLAPLFAFAQPKPAAAPPAGDFLTAGEQLDACAAELPKHLECKQEFCNAMVDIRKKLQPKFATVDKAELVTACLAEIAVDGTGDAKARRDRCEGWSKGRPPMKVARSEQATSAACFEKATCGERIACWAPLTEKRMAAMSPPKK
jgi:hypothetical protein